MNLYSMRFSAPNRDSWIEEVLTLAVSSTFISAFDVKFRGSRRSVALEIDDAISRRSGVRSPLGWGPTRLALAVSPVRWSLEGDALKQEQRNPHQPMGAEECKICGGEGCQIGTCIATFDPYLGALRSSSRHNLLAFESEVRWLQDGE
jgi:hypothetical protein